MSNPSPLTSSPTVPRTNNGRHRRRILPQIGAVILVLLIVAGFWPKPAAVETVRVTKGRLRVTVNEEGKTRIKQRFLISAPVPGQLRRIPFKAGAEVKAGETLLAVIDPVNPTMLDARARALAEARREVAAANLEKARTDHEFAASELKRVTRLHQEQIVSIQDLESVQWREAVSAREKASSESSFRLAEAELAEFTIASPGKDSTRAIVEVRSPVSGRILRIFEESTRVVSASTPLMEIGDPTDIEVVIEALSRDGAAVAVGARVELEQWGGPELLEAKVRLVEPAAFTKISALGVEEQRVNVVADLVTPPAKRLNVGDNFRVEARIVTWEQENVLKIVSGALFRRGQHWAAFVIRDGVASLQPVTAGRSSGAETQILDGLREGDEVIVYPGDRIHEGQRVVRVQISGTK